MSNNDALTTVAVLGVAWFVGQRLGLFDSPAERRARELRAAVGSARPALDWRLDPDFHRPSALGNAILGLWGTGLNIVAPGAGTALTSVVREAQRSGGHHVAGSV